MMERKTQSGYLVLADISGYTSFVAQTEIEHAGVACSYLLETIVETLDDLLTIAKLEGDAVFAYVEESKLEDCRRLLDLIDQTYLAFRERALELHEHTTCPCKACKTLPTLDLKIMLHYGDFVIQQVAGIRDLLGTDVNLIHRLLKNGVSEATGWKGYALFTDQALQSMQCPKDNYFQRCESYEHLGDVNIYCMDMHVRYEEMKAS
jgi:class 3 adenylate cyclase